MTRFRKAALTACSDPVSRRSRPEIEELRRILEAEGLIVETSPALFQEDVFDQMEKAEALNRFFRDPEMDCIFDISGGDLANSVLPYIDYRAAGMSRAKLYGYSDLSVVLNAVTGTAKRETVNYQIRNLLYDHADEQRKYFRETILEDRISPSDLEVRFLRGSRMQGKVLGGNVRCFLKLAGTPWWPDMQGSILLLESLGGGAPQMITALNQYRQAGVLDDLGGVLLGTFTKMEQEQISPGIEEIALRIVPGHIPVAVTHRIGHGTDARAIVLGRELSIQSGSPAP